MADTVTGAGIIITGTELYPLACGKRGLSVRLALAKADDRGD